LRELAIWGSLPAMNDVPWHPRPAMNSRRKQIRDALQRAVDAIDPETGRPMLDLVAEATVAQARSGDVSAANFIADRLDGRVPTPIVGSDEEPPLLQDVTNKDLASALLLLIDEMRAAQPSGVAGVMGEYRGVEFTETEPT